MDLPNIIVVVFDTLRLDGLSCYGGQVATPNIDRFAAESVRLERAVTTAPWTAPSHASLFTGRYPSEHGIHETSSEKVDAIPRLMRAYTGDRLSRLLRKQGYQCAAISANPNISNGSGFENGFTHFMDAPFLGDVSREVGFVKKHVPLDMQGSATATAKYLISRGKFPTLIRAYKSYRDVVKKTKASGYPRNKGGGFIREVIHNSSYELPLFLFVNFMEMHEPYLQSRSNLMGLSSVKMQLMDLLGERTIPAKRLQRIRNAYFSQSSVIDYNFGFLVKYLKSAGIYDNSLIILTSDHGQALHEHGFYGHGIFLTDELVRIPMVIKPPNGTTVDKTIEGWQSLSSVYNLVADYVDGRPSLASISQETAFSESYGIQNLINEIPSGSNPQLLRLKELTDVPRKAVFKGRYKLVVEGKHGIVEEFKEDGRSVSLTDQKEVARDLVSEIEIFKGREDFALPDI